MPDREVQGVAVDDDGSGGDGTLGFHRSAQASLDAAVKDFQAELTRASRHCAELDQCDAVSVKHVRSAIRHVCAMGIGEDPARVNPDIWWLSAGIFLASALAIPDAGAMIFGSVDHDPVHKAWFWLILTFCTLILLGLACAAIAFLLALGPYQPRWFLGLKRAVTTIATRRK
jgi:hypothetical protein